MKNLKIAAVLIALITQQCLVNAQLQSDTKEKVKKIEVTGSAELEAVPDEIYVSFTLQEYYNKQKAKMDIDAIQKDFVDRCAKAGISKERIQLQNMSGFDQNNWYWRKRKKEQPDMMASTTYIIKFGNAAEIDRLVNSLDDNATQNMYINKTATSKMEEYRKEVKIKALQAAKAKAQYLCESIGEKLGTALYIKEVEENGYVRPMYQRTMEANMMMDKAGPANEGIDFQKIKIRHEIMAAFSIQ